MGLYDRNKFYSLQFGAMSSLRLWHPRNCGSDFGRMQVIVFFKAISLALELTQPAV